MKYLLLIFMIMCSTVCKANVLTSPAYSWHPCNVWHSTFYPEDEKCNKPIKSSPEPTSAMLIAIGTALIVLKRKNKNHE